MTEFPGAPDLNVEIQLRPLPEAVARARSARSADDARNEEVVRPRIEAHLAVCQMVLQQLERTHRRVADRTDLDLVGHSRAAAIWVLSGRCIGLLRAVLVQVEAGICNEAMVTGRAIHEATRVLLVFGDVEQDELLRLWLADEGKHGYVRPHAARVAQQRFESKLDEAMQSVGLPTVRQTKDLSAELYDRLSRVAHSRRSSCVDAVWQPGREMSYGISSSPIRRAGYTQWAVGMTDEVTNAVGDALGAFHAQGFFQKEVAPLLQALQAIRESLPLDEATVRREAGTC